MRTASLCLILLCFCAQALAQDPPPPESTPAEPPPMPGPTGDDMPPPPPCEPACRSGFVCQLGQCVSACNPPCPATQSCGAGGVCSVPAPAPAPARPLGPPQPYYAGVSTPPPPPRPGVETHDGFMLRLAAGLGSSSASEVLLSGGEVGWRGLAGTFSLDIGGAVAGDLALHGRLASFVTFNPTVEVDGTDLGTAEDLSISFTLFGIGLTYYFMPVNIYLTGVVGISGVSTTFRGETRQGSYRGLGLNFDVGKEWWVSDNWALGVAGRLWMSSIAEDADEGEGALTTTGLLVMFSTTYL